MKEPYISIIVLCYRKFDNLKENLNSIAKQNYKNLEVIIQDDGSPNFDEEEIRTMASSILRDIPWIVNHNNQNKGTVKSFNVAISMSSGEYIFPLSQDDCFYDENVVRSIVDFFCNNAQYKVCTAKRIGRSSKEIYPVKMDINMLKKWDTNELFARVVYRNFISGATLYYKTDFLKQMNGFDESYILVEDYPFVVGMILKDVQIGFLDVITIDYGETGVSNGSVNHQVKKDRLTLYKNIILPNISKIHSKFVKDYCMYFHEKLEHKKNFVYDIFLKLKYWKVSIGVVYAKYVKKLDTVERFYLFNKWK